MTTESSYDAARDNLELVSDMAKCTEHLRMIHDILKNGDEKKILELSKKKENLCEFTEKIFIKWQEEWKHVLVNVRQFMDSALDILRLNNSMNVVFDIIAEFFRSLALCISPKRLARYWPTEVEWLSKLVAWIEEFFVKESSGQGQWTTLYVLILWLSSAVKTPFDLSRFDSQNTETKFVERIVAIITRTATNFRLISVFHILAGSFFSRADILKNAQLFDGFINFLLDGLTPDKQDVLERVSRLRTITTLLKTIDNAQLKPYYSRVFSTVQSLVNSNHELQTKLCIKILGRLSLSQIKPKLLKYRYNCGKRVLDMENLNSSGDENTNPNGEDAEETSDDQEFEFDELPEYFESLIQILIENIHTSAGQAIHYSVAKYLASICWRLPSEFSEEILNHICDDLCQPYQDANAWHGACLTLAEFVRRGYVPIDFMPKVVEVVKQGIFFEEIKGSFALGSFVRDAAAYICWSMARGYDGRLISDYVDQLAPVLINSVCFDKELNCRRAASAVIQELAGRTQCFPHWIDVISRTGFNSVSRTEQTYLEMGFHFGSTYPEFSKPMIQHLCDIKAVHVDPDIRRLAARTLGKLASAQSFHNSEFSAKFLVQMTGNDLNARHGSILSLAYIVENDKQLRESSGFIDEVRQLIPTLISKKLFLGTSGDLMSEACLILVRNCLRHGILIDTPEYSTISSFLSNKILNCQTEFVEQPLVLAIVEFWKSVPSSVRASFLKNILGVFSNHDNYRAISIICKTIVELPEEQTVPKEFFDRLVQFFDDVFHKEIRRSETVADCVLAIVTFAERNSWCLAQESTDKVVRVWIRAMNDHTINKTKGDVGLFVRRAGIQAICTKNWNNFRDDGAIFSLFKFTLAEVLSAQGFTFRVALEKLTEMSVYLLQNSRCNIPAANLRTMQEEITPDMVQIDAFPVLLKFFAVPDLSYWVWFGIVGIISTPGLDKLYKIILSSLKEFDSAIQKNIFEEFLKFYSDSSKDHRLVLPCLKAAKRLVMDSPALDLEFQRRIAEATWASCKSSGNPIKLLAGCDLFCALIPVSGVAILNKAFSYIFVLLGSQTPRVRSYTATRLYSALLSLDEEDDVEGAIDEASTILQESDWLDRKEALDAREKVRIEIRKLVLNK